MSDAMHSHLERFPEGAIEVAQGRILGFNRAAHSQLPELAVGMEAPEFLSGSLSDPEGAGTFSHNGALYLFSRVSGRERDLLLFRPAPQSPLTQGQLDGFVRQMRGFLQDILLEFETVSGPPVAAWAPSARASAGSTACSPTWTSCAPPAPPRGCPSAR